MKAIITPCENIDGEPRDGKPYEIEIKHSIKFGKKYVSITTKDGRYYDLHHIEGNKYCQSGGGQWNAQSIIIKK